MRIDIWEYFPLTGESINDCIERVNKFYEISICPYNIDILSQLIEERKKVSLATLGYWENRYTNLNK